MKARFGGKEWTAIWISLAMLTITASTVIYSAGRMHQQLEQVTKRQDEQQKILLRSLEVQTLLSERISRIEGRNERP